MANTPKKVKDPTEVALSAIQEALKINDAAGPDNSRAPARTEVAPLVAPVAPSFAEPGFEAHVNPERPAF